MTPIIPPLSEYLAGLIMRIAGLPSALVPKVTCPGPPKLEKDAKICSTIAALMGKPDEDC